MNQPERIDDSFTEKPGCGEPEFILFNGIFNPSALGMRGGRRT
jgi:hypothetical protein